MSMYIPQDGIRTPFFRKGWVRYINGSGETIPAHAVMRITNWDLVNGEVVYNVAKPDSTYRWRYLVNGPISVGSDSTHEGYGTFLGDGGLVYCSGTPAVNQMWYPTPSQWYLSQHGPGFLVAGANTETSGGVTVLCAVQVI